MKTQESMPAEKRAHHHAKLPGYFNEYGAVYEYHKPKNKSGTFAKVLRAV